MLFQQMGLSNYDNYGNENVLKEKVDDDLYVLKLFFIDICKNVK